MTTQHTPGPWIVDATPAHAPCCFTIRHNSAICGAWVPLATIHTTIGDTMANARLIASAPELLEALESLLRERYALELPEQFDAGGNWTSNSPASVAARAAIVKAKGGVE